MLSALLLMAADWPDHDTPVRTTERHPADFAVVVGVETYRHLPTVPWARRDAEAFARWLLHTRGVPAARVRRLLDPPAALVRLEIEEALRRVGPDGVLWIYWAGHGAGSAVDGRHWLLAADGQPDGEGLAVELLQQRAAASEAGRVVLVLDASFGGVGRDGTPLAGTVRWHLPEIPDDPDPRVITWAATGPGEIAAGLPPVEQGAFTWAALGALSGWADGVFGARDGLVTLEEAQAWVRRALDDLHRRQTPSVDPRPEARAWVIGPALRPAPSLDDLDPLPAPPEDPWLTAGPDPEEEQRARARQEAEAEIRRQVQEHADRDWARVFASARSGRPEGLQALRDFIARYAARTYLWEGQEIVVTASQIPEARRLLASGGRSSAPLVEAVRIEPTTFQVGSPVGTPGRGNDETLHTVTLTRPYEIATTEVTRHLWTTVTGTPAPGEGRPDLPVTSVSWFEAAAFCNALSLLDGYDPAYAIRGRNVTPIPGADGWRLPTEAEWVLAAGRDPAEPCRVANVRDRSAAPEALSGVFSCDDGHTDLSPVRALSADERGLYGMIGNAAEWVFDAWVPFDGTPDTDPAPDAPARLRVVKGGSHLSGPGEARVQARRAVPAQERRADVGFRVARTPR